VLWAQSYWHDLHEGGLYRPLFLTLLWCERAVFGDAAWAYRLVNLALHAGCSIMVVRLATRIGLGRWAPLAGLVFAAHPVHAEAVVTIYGQSDLWAALFGMAAIDLASGGQRGDVGRRRMIAAGTCYGLSMLCKESAVLLPLVLPLLWTLSENGSQDRPKRGWRGLIGFVVVLVGYLGLRFAVLGPAIIPSGEGSVAHGYTVWARVNLFVVTVGTYLRLLVWPFGLTVYYGHLRESIFGTPWVELAFLLVTFVIALQLDRVLPHRAWTFVKAWFLVALLPVANVLPIGTVVAERCLYLPSVAFALLIAMGARRLESERALPARRVVGGAALVLAMALCWNVCWSWRTPESLWRHTVEAHPKSPAAHARYAVAILTRISQAPRPTAHPDWPTASDAVATAFELNPRSPEAWLAKAFLAHLQGDTSSAREAMREWRRFHPVGDPNVILLRQYLPPNP